MAESIIYNCSARIEKNVHGENETKGNCTEQGILKFLLANGVKAYEMLLKKND